MKYIKTFEKHSIGDKLSIEDHIKNARIPKEYKEVALGLLTQFTEVKKSKIYGLELHPDLKKKIRENNLPNGFHMCIDKNGYYISTHRCRSKSHKSPDKITFKEIKFIDSTG